MLDLFIVSIWLAMANQKWILFIVNHEHLTLSSSTGLNHEGVSTYLCLIWCLSNWGDLKANLDAL